MNTPQYVDETLCRALGRQILVKVETANPLRCFKGRGADVLMSRFRPGQRVVCASTGNFGAAIAYAGRRHGVTVDVFAPADVNPVKRARMEAFGARVTPVGRDSAECQEAARSHAAATPGCVFIQDGVEDRDLLEAMGLAAQTLGLLLEPSGAAGLAAIQVHDLSGERLATVLTGSNLRPEHLTAVTAREPDSVGQGAARSSPQVAANSHDEGYPKEEDKSDDEARIRET